MRIMLAMLIVLLVATAVISADKRVVNNHAELGCADCHGVENPEKKPKGDVCFSCHGKYEDVANLTKSLAINPHNSHQGEIRCAVCHVVHAEPVLYCNDCHEYDMKVK